VSVREALRSERGAVLVIVGAMILPLTLLLAFAIESGWWWTHHRHLQTEADAAVLAGASGSWLPGCNDTPGDSSSIVGQALQYSGDQNRAALYNFQYADDAAKRVHVLINSSTYWAPGGTNADNTALGGSPCESLGNFSGATCQPQSQTPTCPNLDVKLTDYALPTFLGSIPGFTSVTTHAHARVEIQAGQQENGIRPIAVRDDATYLSGEILLYRANADGSVGAQYGSPICLPVRTTHDPEPSPGDPTSYTQFTNGSGTNVAMPGPTPESLLIRVRLYANVNCSGASEIFPQTTDGTPTGGLNFINVNDAGVAGDGQRPQAGAVRVAPGTCSPDGYFSSLFAYPTDPDPCSATVNASVSFSPGAITCGAGKNAFIKIYDNGAGSQDANGCGGDWQAGFAIPAEDLAHQFTMEWAQTYGTVSGYGTCLMPNNGNPFANQNPCHDFFSGSGGVDLVQQQAFAGTDDSTLASNSGTITLVQIGEGPSSSGANSFVQGTTHELKFTVRVGGLANARPTDPPIVIRYAVQNYKRTGVVDCGQGTGSQYDAIVNGCPRPIYLWTGGNCGPPPPNAAPDNTPAGTPIDCVGIVPGNRRGQIRQAFHDRVGTSCNNWMAWKASNGTLAGFPPTGDPRLLPMVVTPPADLSGGGGSTANVPVVRIATFYVTGGDGLSNPASSCASPTDQNEPFPGSARRSGNNAIWGHFIKYVNPGGGIGSGIGCNQNQFGDCVAVLTQ
jgi:Putative Flp pilus-assembly TadE/G-like